MSYKDIAPTSNTIGVRFKLPFSSKIASTTLRLMEYPRRPFLSFSKATGGTTIGAGCDLYQTAVGFTSSTSGE